jgi:hypothetical protein
MGFDVFTVIGTKILRSHSNYGELWRRVIVKCITAQAAITYRGGVIPKNGPNHEGARKEIRNGIA